MQLYPHREITNICINDNVRLLMSFFLLNTLKNCYAPFDLHFLSNNKAKECEKRRKEIFHNCDLEN